MSDIEVDPQPMPAREVIEYFEIPLRRPWLTLVPFVVFTVGALASYVTAAKWYQSASLILVESEKVPELLTKTVLEKSGDRIRVLKQEMLSRTRLERIVRELEPYPEYSGKRAASEIVEYMRNLIDVQVKGDDAFAITYVHKNPYLAMAVTNRLATLFIEEAGQARQQQLSTANKFIQTQLDEARQSLADTEKQLRALKEKYMGALPEELSTNLNTLTRLQTERQTLQTAIASAEQRALELERSMNEEMSRAMPAAAVAAAAFSPARQQYEKTRQELVDLQSRYTAEHPEVKRASARLVRLQQQVEAEAAAAPSMALPTPIPNPMVTSLRTQLGESRIEIFGLRSRAAEVDRRIADYEQRVAATPHAEQELSELLRDSTKLHENYETILKTKLDAEMAESLERQWKGQRYRMLDPAFLPDRPYSPQIGKYLSIGLALGLSLGLGAAVLAELLDHSVKNARELEVVLPHPLLVTVPHMTRRRVRRRSDAVESPV
jgi:polysaccharide chain length determinant protein (PEP-CTERM system associated)